MIQENTLELFKDEMNITLHVFESVSDDIFSYRPHNKSKSVEELVNHMVAIPSWVTLIVNNPVLDWAKYTPPAQVKSKAELIAVFKENVTNGIAALEQTSDANLTSEWSMKNDDFTFFSFPKYKGLTRLVINHTIHHRAQLGLYIRMNDINMPASYVASADENLFG